MSAFDDYQKLFLRLWHEGGSFILVEHDVVPSRGALKRLAECKHEWCACPYGSGAASLGCVKISDSLIGKLPNIWEKMPLRHWHYCDSWFNTNAEKVASVHRHELVAKHLHVDTPVTAKGPLITRVRRKTKYEFEVAFYDPKIEYEFAAVTFNRAKLPKDVIAERLTGELKRLNQIYFPGEK